MSRHDLKELGEHLDRPGGVVVVAVADMGAKVEKAMQRAAKLEQKQIEADTAALERDAAESATDLAAKRAGIRQGLPGFGAALRGLTIAGRSRCRPARRARSTGT